MKLTKNNFVEWLFNTGADKDDDREVGYELKNELI